MANFDDSKITIQIGDAELAAVTKKMQESMKEYLKVHTPKPPTEDDFEEYLFNKGLDEYAYSTSSMPAYSGYSGSYWGGYTPKLGHFSSDEAPVFSKPVIPDAAAPIVLGHYDKNLHTLDLQISVKINPQFLADYTGCSSALIDYILDAAKKDVEITLSKYYKELRGAWPDDKEP